jgi:hypothetical protein
VRAGVQKIFALEIYARADRMFGQTSWQGKAESGGPRNRATTDQLVLKVFHRACRFYAEVSSSNGAIKVSGTKRPP